MSRKYWIGIGKEGENELGLEIEADRLTIEPSGALTLWEEDARNPISHLLMAFAPGHWTKCHLVSTGRIGDVINKLDDILDKAT